MAILSDYQVQDPAAESLTLVVIFLLYSWARFFLLTVCFYIQLRGQPDK